MAKPKQSRTQQSRISFFYHQTKSRAQFFARNLPGQYQSLEVNRSHILFNLIRIATHCPQSSTSEVGLNSMWSVRFSKRIWNGISWCFELPLDHIFQPQLHKCDEGCICRNYCSFNYTVICISSSIVGIVS